MSTNMRDELYGWHSGFGRRQQARCGLPSGGYAMS